MARLAARIIGSNIRRYRDAHGWTQNELGYRAGGFSSDQVAKWERAEKEPRDPALARLAQALSVEIPGTRL